MSEVVSKPTRSCNFPTATNWQSANDTERPVTTWIVTCFFVRGFLIPRLLRYPHPGKQTNDSLDFEDVSPSKNGGFSICHVIFLGGVSFTNFTSSLSKKWWIFFVSQDVQLQSWWHASDPENQTPQKPSPMNRRDWGWSIIQVIKL